MNAQSNRQSNKHSDFRWHSIDCLVGDADAIPFRLIYWIIDLDGDNMPVSMSYSLAMDMAMQS